VSRGDEIQLGVGFNMVAKLKPALSRQKMAVIVYAQVCHSDAASA
jgi:hypothetical protein